MLFWQLTSLAGCVKSFMLVHRIFRFLATATRTTDKTRLNLHITILYFQEYEFYGFGESHVKHKRRKRLISPKKFDDYVITPFIPSPLRNRKKLEDIPENQEHNVWSEKQASSESDMSEAHFTELSSIKRNLSYSPSQGRNPARPFVEDTYVRHSPRARRVGTYVYGTKRVTDSNPYAKQYRSYYRERFDIFRDQFSSKVGIDPKPKTGLTHTQKNTASSNSSKAASPQLKQKLTPSESSFKLNSRKTAHSLEVKRNLTPSESPLKLNSKKTAHSPEVQKKLTPSESPLKLNLSKTATPLEFKRKATVIETIAKLDNPYEKTYKTYSSERKYTSLDKRRKPFPSHLSKRTDKTKRKRATMRRGEIRHKPSVTQQLINKAKRDRGLRLTIKFESHLRPKRDHKWKEDENFLYDPKLVRKKKPAEYSPPLVITKAEVIQIDDDSESEQISVAEEVVLSESSESVQGIFVLDNFILV